MNSKKYLKNNLTLKGRVYFWGAYLSPTTTFSLHNFSFPEWCKLNTSMTKFWSEEQQKRSKNLAREGRESMSRSWRANSAKESKPAMFGAKIQNHSRITPSRSTQQVSVISSHFYSSECTKLPKLAREVGVTALEQLEPFDAFRLSPSWKFRSSRFTKVSS